MASAGNEVVWQVRIEEDNQYRKELATLCEQLREEAINNIEYFQDLKGINNERFYVNFVHLYDHLDSGIQPALDEFTRFLHLYDFDPSLPANGYRSIILVVHRCCQKILQLVRYISANRESFLFRGTHYSKELDAYVSTLGQLRACLYYVERLQHYCANGQLIPDEDELTPEQYEVAEQMMIEVESLSQETFYGRCLGFQFCNSMVKTLTTINLVLASFGDGYDQESNIMKFTTSLMGGSRYFLDSELRAQQVVNVTRNGDIRFCKAFWSLAENELMHSLPLIVCPPVAIDKVIVLEPEPFEIPLADNSDVIRINPPCAHSGPRPVYTRLLSFEMREGQESWKPPKKSSGTKICPPSSSLIIQIHGGGFVAQSSASHQTYLRHWAKDLHVPILCIDYSLAPEDPFPRQLEEVFFAYCWALKHCRLLGSTGEKICMVGDSAGANLCVASTMRAASFGLRIPDGILSIYGSMLIRYTPSPSRMLALMDPLLPIGILSKCITAYAGTTTIPTTPLTTPTDNTHNCNVKAATPGQCQQQETDSRTEENKADYEVELKSEDLSADIQEAMIENIYKETNCLEEESGDSNDFQELEESLSDLHIASPEDKFSDALNEIGDTIPECSSAESIASTSRKGHKYTSSIDSGYHGSTKGGLRSRVDVCSEESSAEESITPSNSASPISEHKCRTPDLTDRLPKKTNDDRQNVRSENNPESVNSTKVTKTGLDLDLRNLHRHCQSSSPSRCPSSQAVDDLPQKLKLKDRIKVQSPLSPSSPFLGTDGILNATTPTYAKIRHFAQSPVQHFRHFPISKNPYMSPYLASPELLKDLCPVYFVVSELDPLLDDSIEFAKKLRDLGKEVHIECVDNLPHGFLNFILTSAEAKQASDICVNKIHEILHLNQLSDEDWEILDEGLDRGELDDLLDDDDLVNIDRAEEAGEGSSVDLLSDIVKTH